MPTPARPAWLWSRGVEVDRVKTRFACLALLAGILIVVWATAGLADSGERRSQPGSWQLALSGTRNGAHVDVYERHDEDADLCQATVVLPYKVRSDESASSDPTDSDLESRAACVTSERKTVARVLDGRTIRDPVRFISGKVIDSRSPPIVKFKNGDRRHALFSGTTWSLPFRRGVPTELIVFPADSHTRLSCVIQWPDPTIPVSICPSAR
jgi:hypothetical protein